FIRIRTLGIPERTELYKDVQAGDFEPLGDVGKAEEILLFLENLNGINSSIISDHILNLFQEVEGSQSNDKEGLTSPIRKFLKMAKKDQLLYIVGRRTGIFNKLDDLNDRNLSARAEKLCTAHGVTIDNVEEFAAEMIKRFI
ncbi:MAG: radical SAM protein, partial [Proteobacteria bacterium]|nr:radical SAM protein [Pseudomonadota bacterium]